MLQVSIRVRPPLKHESQSHWFTNGDRIHSAKKSFTFQSVETEFKTQTIYTKLAKSLVQQALSGYHATILCYGQTTSGKTYTTLGVHNNPGILPCALRDVFLSNCKIYIQYIQIYNETIEDLLIQDSNSQNIKIVEDNQYGTTLQLKRIRVKDFQTAIQLLNQGEEKRIYRETQIHEHSSRSHTMFKIYLEGNGHFSCLNIVDLAGSERLQDQDINHETGYINKSLLSLTNVINQLADSKQQHISYRDSKLTRLLSNSLGGNAYTLLICCVSPANQNQTLTTLQFAQRAKKVENTPKENVFQTKNVENLSQQKNVEPLQQEQQCNPRIFNYFKDNSDQFINNPSYSKLLRYESEFMNKYNQLLKQFRQQVNQIKEFEKDGDLQQVIQQFLFITEQPEQPMQFHHKAYIWGSGQDGRLGQGDEKPCKIPTLFPQIQFTSISCGYHHTIGISQGFVYSWGRGQRGQLGLDDTQNQYTPTRVPTLKEVSQIACGWQHSMAIAENSLYTWGYGEDGQLGDGECIQRNKPQLIVESVECIFAGHSNSGFIKKGMLYTFGNNTDGRCMIDYLGILGAPEQVPLNDILHVSLGVSHMGVVVKDGSVYMAGTSTDGQLGLYSADDEVATWFTQLEKFNGINNKAVKIACGDCFTLVLNSKGFVYSFGKGSYKRLGHSNTNTLYEPTPIQLDNVRDVVAGCRHAGAITKDNNIYLWGFNFHNQLGLGGEDQDQEPIQLELKNVQSLSLGYFHTAALTNN